MGIIRKIIDFYNGDPADGAVSAVRRSYAGRERPPAVQSAKITSFYREPYGDNPRSVSDLRLTAAASDGYADGNAMGYSRNGLPSAPDAAIKRAQKIKSADGYSREALSNINMYRPRSFDDIVRLVDSIKFKESVIVELCYLPDETMQKMLDFMSGAIYALNGSMQRISQSTFLFTPPFVRVIDNQD
ncbi:MAG: cell division protein SepF [Clostridiales bacterium]|jgi:hypothetical protein|nr:cell division protein SepF [Clostridiales bacterium]